MVKNPPATAGNARDLGAIPESGRSPGGGNGLENSTNPQSHVFLPPEEPGGLQSTGSQRVGHSLSDGARTHVTTLSTSFSVPRADDKTAMRKGYDGIVWPRAWGGGEEQAIVFAHFSRRHAEIPVVRICAPLPGGQVLDCTQAGVKDC